MRKLLTVIVLCLFSFGAEAQEDYGIWQYVTVSKSFDNGWGLFVRLEDRLKNNAQSHDVGLFMPGVTYSPAGWLKLGFIYDYARTTKADRHVLLPYVQVSGKSGRLSWSLRELAQFYAAPKATSLYRTKLLLKYNIPDCKVAPSVFFEPYISADGSFLRMSNFFGVNCRFGKHSNVEAGYNAYYLKSMGGIRHLLSVGYTYFL